MEINLNRGDIVICVLQGDYGKGRPALVVQSDFFNSTHANVVVCPITSHLIDAPLFRIPLSPAAKNNLQKPSQVMVDKLSAIKHEKITEKIGSLSTNEMHAVDHALKMWLAL